MRAHSSDPETACWTFICIIGVLEDLLAWIRRRIGWQGEVLVWLCFSQPFIVCHTPAGISSNTSLVSQWALGNMDAVRLKSLLRHRPTYVIGTLTLSLCPLFPILSSESREPRSCQQLECSQFSNISRCSTRIYQHQLSPCSNTQSDRHQLWLMSIQQLCTVRWDSLMVHGRHHEEDWVEGKGRRPVTMGRSGKLTWRVINTYWTISSNLKWVYCKISMSFAVCTVQNFGLDNKKSVFVQFQCTACSMIGASWVRCKNKKAK